MQLDLDYHYQITFIPYRHQNTQHVTASASATVEVPEPTPEEAPVVMRVGNPAADAYGQSSKRFFFKEDGAPREVRLYRGRHYVEAGTASELEELSRTDLSSTFFGRCRPRNSSIDNGQAGYARNRIWNLEEVLRQHSSPSTPMRTCKDDNGEAMAKKLHRLASLMFIVDGRVFEYTPEPILKIERGDGPARIVARPSPYGGYSNDSHRFHDFEYGGSVRSALKHSHTVLHMSEKGDLPYVEVIDPSASTFDGATYDVCEGAAELSRHLQSHVSGLPWNALEAFYDLRDALDDSQERVTPRLLAALSGVAGLQETQDIDRVARIASRTEAAAAGWHDSHSRNNIYKKRLEFMSGSGVYGLKEMAEDILARWDARPADAYWENGVAPVSCLKSAGCRVSELLSEGVAVDKARMAGADPSEALAAAANGDRLLVVETVHQGQGDRATAMAVASADGALRVIGSRGFQDSLEDRFRALLSASDASRHDYGLVASPALTGGF